MADESHNQVNLLDLLAFVLRWRKSILITVIAVSVAVAIFSLVVEPKYRSSGMVRASESSNQTIGSLISSRLASLGGVSGFAPGLGEISGQLFIVILKGREISEKVIDHFDLRSVFDTGDAPIEDVIDILRKRTNFELEPQSSSITIDVEDSKPGRAREIVAYYIDQLDLKLQRISAKRASRERVFVGQRLEEARSRLSLIEDSLHSFQMETGVLDIEEQIKATIQAAAALQAQKYLVQAELELNTQIFDSGSPEIRLLRMKAAGLDSTLATLVRKRETDAPPDFLLHLLDTPEQGKRYLRLMREIEIQQLLVLYLTQQHEQQKIESVRNTPTISIIQAPVEATKRVWPRRGLMVALAAFGAFVFTVVVGLIVEFFRDASVDPEHPQHARMRKLRRSWSE